LVNRKGVNFKGQKIARWKGGSSLKHSVITVDFFKNWLTCKALVLHIVKSYKKSCLLALLKYSTGSYSYILSPSGLEPGFFVKILIKPTQFSVAYRIGYTLLLKYLIPNTIVFNVETLPLTGGRYCRAAGTFAEILVIDDLTNLVLVQLPTNDKIWIYAYCFATLGRASNDEHLLSVIGKAGLNRNTNKRPTVRGVAKNPVDHPHGGRTKTNSPELTPWHKTAKKNR
jgi:large subunit ribosomal protein L2